jgi:hypothetical protein
MPPVPPPRQKPRWAEFIEDQARQTSTRSGLLFLAFGGAGVALTEAEITTIMSIAGAVAAVFAFIFPDRDSAGE